MTKLFKGKKEEKKGKILLFKAQDLVMLTIPTWFQMKQDIGPK